MTHSLCSIVQYLARLDSSRAQEEESLIETAICLRAIDKLLGNEDGAKKSPQPAEGEYVPPKVCLPVALICMHACIEKSSLPVVDCRIKVGQPRRR